MADVRIRKLPEPVVAAFRRRAAAAGRSMEEEPRLLLTEAAARPKENRVAELRAFRGMLRRKYGMLSDSTSAIRDEREGRG